MMSIGVEERLVVGVETGMARADKLVKLKCSTGRTPLDILTCVCAVLWVSVVERVK